MIFVVSQSLYTLALMFLLGLVVVAKSAVGSAGTNPSTTLYSRTYQKQILFSPIKSKFAVLNEFKV
jgi:hypothetical protein